MQIRQGAVCHSQDSSTIPVPRSRLVHGPATPVTRRKKAAWWVKLDGMTGEEALLGLWLPLALAPTCSGHILLSGLSREGSGMLFLEVSTQAILRAFWVGHSQRALYFRPVTESALP